jgi:hypothetical protein
MQQQFPEDFPDLSVEDEDSKPSPAMQKLLQVLEEKKFDYIIRCPHCKSFYPNPVPKTAPGGVITLKCKPSKQWRGRRPPVPEGERAQWCGKMFRIRVETEVERAARQQKEKYQKAQAQRAQEE